MFIREYTKKMNIVILGGKSKRHYEWIRELKEQLQGLAEEVVIHDYKHWLTYSARVDINEELRRIARTVSSKEPYIIVAKSLGTVLATIGTSKEILDPRACVFLGTPLSVIKEEFPHFQENYHALPRTIFVQNENDPLGSSQELGVFLEAGHPYDWELITLPGDTHDYTDFDVLYKLLAGLKE